MFSVVNDYRKVIFLFVIKLTVPWINKPKNWAKYSFTSPASTNEIRNRNCALYAIPKAIPKNSICFQRLFFLLSVGNIQYLHQIKLCIWAIIYAVILAGM